MLLDNCLSKDLMTCLYLVYLKMIDYITMLKMVLGRVAFVLRPLQEESVLHLFSQMLKGMEYARDPMVQQQE